MSANLLEYIRDSELGANLCSQTPFGTRALIYADYTASGRALGFIEDYVAREVLPKYANTHTLASNNGRQSSEYVAEARQMVKALTHISSTRLYHSTPR